MAIELGSHFHPKHGDGKEKKNGVEITDPQQIELGVWDQFHQVGDHKKIDRRADIDIAGEILRQKIDQGRWLPTWARVEVKPEMAPQKTPSPMPGLRLAITPTTPA